MALVACTDKQKKHRVKASGNLPRVDYYCPHKGCDAVLTLVDCDDEIRTDHFRTKPSSSHSEDCPYRQNDVYLQENGFTNIENQIIDEVLSKLKEDINFLGQQIKSVLGASPVFLSRVTSTSLSIVDYKEDNTTDSLNKIYSKIKRIQSFVEKCSANKFKYDGIKDIDLYSMPLPFAKTKLYENFFATDTPLVKRCANLLEVILHQHWYSNKWAHFYLNLFSHTYDEIRNIALFKTLDECAKDFASRYNRESIRLNKEFLSGIFKCEDKGEVLYYYLNPRIGNTENISNQIFNELHKKDIPVADVHTHSAYVPEDLGGDVFSPYDLQSIKEMQKKYGAEFVSYLATPNGSLKKTDGETQELICTDIPNDVKDPYKSITVDVLFDIHSRQYYKVPLDAKSQNDIRKAPRLIDFVWMDI